MTYLFWFIPLMFPIMWAATTFVISKFGWAALAENYASPEPFTGTRIGLISAMINKVSYNNSLIMKYNDKGIHLVPLYIFRLFHQPVLIPWDEIKEVRDKKVFFTPLKELIIGAPQVAKISITEKLYSKLEEGMNLYTSNKRPVRH